MANPNVAPDSPHALARHTTRAGIHRDTRDRVRWGWHVGSTGAAFLALGWLVAAIAVGWCLAVAPGIGPQFAWYIAMVHAWFDGQSVQLYLTGFPVIGLTGLAAVLLAIGLLRFLPTPHRAAQIGIVVAAVAIVGGVLLGRYGPLVAILDVPGRLSAPFLLGLGACFVAYQQAAYGARSRLVMAAATLGAVATLGLAAVLLLPVTPEAVAESLRPMAAIWEDIGLSGWMLPGDAFVGAAVVGLLLYAALVSMFVSRVMAQATRALSE